MKNNHVRALCESAVLLALAIALSFVKLFSLPLGGSVTAASMLPIFIICLRHGPRWGFAGAFGLSLINLFSSGIFGWGLTPGMLIASLLLDYILAYTALGIAGFFAKKNPLGKIIGVGVACVVRFSIHFLSGIILWTNYAEFVAFGVEWVNHPVLYSICYNGAFMLPETLITVALAVVLIKLPQTKKFFEV